AAGILDPVRYGSQWIIAAYAATGAHPASTTGARPAKGAAPAPAWAVAYDSLDALLTRARFDRVAKDGYDFAVTQTDPLTHRPRQLFESRPDIPTDTVSSAIRAPAALTPPGAPAYLDLAVRPHAGWYPIRDLATEIGLLALLTWALAFGAHELAESAERAQGELDQARKRLHTVNERLTAEIEQHQALQKSLEHARYHDTFTGLPNRRYFMDQLDRALREVRTRHRQRIALVLIEIDRFKLINDTLGHTAGDELMLQAAQRFAKALTGLECVLSHWEGGQLALLLYEVNSADAAQAIAGKLLGARQEPFTLRQHRISVASRMGLTCIDSGLQRAEEALREADIALSLAKRPQSPPVVTYTPGMGGAAVSLVSLEADLHIALDRRQFRLLFQPIVDLRGRRVVGAEALLRWRHPVEGLLTPEKFLPIAEEAGVIVPVTRWIIQRVCRLAAEWRQRLPQAVDFYFSVNLSAAALRDPGLREYVARVLHDTHAAPRQLKFELTEVGLINNVGAARELLTGFHDMGIELMLDDFGTGYSSLSYLQLFPFKYVKIDRPLVNWTGSERSNNAITSAILQMTSNLGLRAVAEVVETQAAAQALLRMGCDYGQGYFFCEPVEAEEALHQLRTYNGPPSHVPVIRAPEGEAGAAEATGDYSPTVVLPREMSEEGSNDDTVLLTERFPRRS
ncbi:MAG TPA: bifunctional diguanylate cyclase/phosphodiesterase, partial [Steroidobacteraceae bacterium]|nr:bifunctional diguanylate cyclase/phosphodiesterase [Steroidobacteraceae bacterium]